MKTGLYTRRFRGDAIDTLRHRPTAEQVKLSRLALAALVPAWKTFRACEEAGRGLPDATEELLEVIREYAGLFRELKSAELVASRDDAARVHRLGLMCDRILGPRDAQWIAEHQIELFSAAAASR
jgi:hypothetical protein